ncbi:chloride channel protein [Pedobacter sp. SD-b]|uniref:Chloride channel protein n=1 Tax=Pedobacter segetis TaxID=2793069 RepID=A0ABS1BJT4_9SPHI|nr:chloride channel protein [Pedobacter segetis]MBK0383116.1 chloride channel protein [Pedobacter segetis]
MRKTIITINYLKLIITSAVVSLFAVLLAVSLKKATEHFEHLIFGKASLYPLLFIILPSVGITLIYFLRKYLFKGKQNKGIKEIYQTIDNRKNMLPTFKVPSHYFNGFLTVIFGGSTGVEVSTVVATAAIGAVAQRKTAIANIYKTELICAGVASGIAMLFVSPIAGFLFAIEVIARKKLTFSIVLSCGISVLVSWLSIILLGGETLFKFSVINWNTSAIPFFIILSVLVGALAVYFTKAVIYIKGTFAKIENNFIRVNSGAILVGIGLLFLPQLYGDSYHAIPGLMDKINQQPFSLSLMFLLLIIALLKPLAASLTLGAGGDGGVFAPSIVAGAVLGMLTAMMLNHYLGTHLIILNFALLGAAGMLSAAIHAPLTSIFLICSMVPGGYLLFVPVLICSFIAKYAAQFLCSYTVYSYNKP